MKNGKGEYDSRTEWHRCTAWGRLAEFAGKLDKGAHIHIEGELRYRGVPEKFGTEFNGCADQAPPGRDSRAPDLKARPCGKAG